MPVIEWVEDLSVHVAEIDEQHKAIIEIINELHDALLNKEITELESARTRVLDAMEERIVSHFSTEEKFMARIGYPDVDEHREKHRAFLALLRQYKGDCREGALSLNSELMKTLGNWFLEHEMLEDQKYSSFYSEGAS